MDDRSACEVFVSHDQLALCCSAVTGDMDATDTLAARQYASNLLAYLSGWTVYGTCEARVRPQGVICIDGQDAIPLTWPVRGITSVFIDGTELEPTKYALVDKRYLIRRDCLSWPCHQWLGHEATEQWTFEILYSYGTDIPWPAVAAAAELSCDYLVGCTGGACRLPATATSLNTQGMSLSLAGSEAMAAVARGELPAVQEFMTLVNPGGSFGVDVYSPDMPKLRKVEYFSAPS